MKPQENSKSVFEELRNTWEIIRKMPNGDEKESEIVSLSKKVDKMDDTSVTLLFTASILEELAQSRHCSVWHF